MCEPTTIMMIGAAVISAYGMHEQGQAAKEMGEYSAKVSENNAKTAEYAAKDAEHRGAIEEDAQRRQVRQVMGQQRVGLAAQGGDLTDQSSVNILSDTAQFGELDALTVRSNAAREAWGMRVQGVDAINKAQASRYEGKATARSANISAFGTLLAGGAQAYGMGAKGGLWGKSAGGPVAGTGFRSSGGLGFKLG